jgi:RNA polymerase primary sigma factor
MAKADPNMLVDIVASAKKRGFITQEEILSLFPKPEDHVDDLDHLYDKLLKADIDVFESVAESQDS